MALTGARFREHNRLTDYLPARLERSPTLRFSTDSATDPVPIHAESGPSFLLILVALGPASIPYGVPVRVTDSVLMH
jgi:hypothetical protein